jgi:hypothetical protein
MEKQKIVGKRRLGFTPKEFWLHTKESPISGK